MLDCAKALLYYGTPIDALDCKILPRFHHGTKIDAKIYENPLDGSGATRDLK